MSRRTFFVGLVIAGAWWLHRGHKPSAVHERMRLQAAVLPNGFAAVVRARDVHDSTRVIEVDRGAGFPERNIALQLSADVRLVGTRTGVMVGWAADRRLKLATLDGDGRPDKVTTWGKNVETLCDGAASNEHRFAVGWLDSDRHVSFVTGTVEGAVVSMNPSTASANVTWCGVASAERNVAVFRRDADSLTMSFCGAGTCTDEIPVPIGADDKILGFGCVADSCLIAARDRRHDTIKLHHVTSGGQTIVEPLDDATLGTLASIVGVGTHAFAVAYMTQNGFASIKRFAVDGTMTDAWGHSGADEAPTIAWAADKLFIVSQSAFSSEETYAVDMPR